MFAKFNQFMVGAWLALMLLGSPNIVMAQSNVWVQIEAQPTLAEAEARARAYSSSFPNVNGFRMRSGWYAISIGPFDRLTADRELRTLRRNRQIPNDSFIAFQNQYRQQFWPTGGSAAAAAIPTTQQTTTETETAAVTTTQELTVIPEQEETPRQARASEQLLDRAGRMLLQEAMQWDGFYTAAIDGSFGKGTRRAMAAYQESIGATPTGVLTTRQREKLIGDYQAVFDKLGLASLRDEDAGIDILMPQGLVKYQKIEPPFVHYDAINDSNVRVLLISQLGEQAELSGLYDIMQTLEIVPPEGQRERKRQSFVLTGQDENIHSYTYAALKGGKIKGFTMIWDPADAKLMNKIALTMKDSLVSIADRVMPDTAGTTDGSSQRVDLMAGLQLRRPDVSRSGFYVDGAGAVLTTTDALGQCKQITVNEDIVMDITARDDGLGLALLTPQTGQAPLAYAKFRSEIPRLQSEIAVAGYSYEDLLTLPVLTFGRLADIRGLSGEEGIQRLALSTLPGDAGGPVLDQTGSVVGMLLPRNEASSRKLPQDVNFATNVENIAEFLTRAGLTPTPSEQSSGLPPEDLTVLAGDLTVLVSCWN